MKIGLIYKYENKINKKVYIGQTKCSLHKRHIKHLTQMRRNYDDYFHRALRKYGVENFELSIVEDNIPIDKLDEKEIYYIKEYDSFYTSNKGYNMTKGGKWGSPTQKIYGSKEKEIKKLIIETNLSFREIAKKVGLDRPYSVSSINNGEIFREDSLNYPLRKTTKPKKIDNETFNEILNDIKNTKLTFIEIACKYNTNVYLLNKINKGTFRLCKETNINYPIRHSNVLGRYNTRLNEDDVIEICRLMLFESLTFKEISDIFGLKPNAIGDISRGISWGDITHDMIYPILKNKHINQEIFKNKYGIV